MGNLMETPWEHDRNTTQKIPSPLPLPPKGKKKTEPFMSAC